MKRIVLMIFPLTFIFIISAMAEDAAVTNPDAEQFLMASRVCDWANTRPTDLLNILRSHKTSIFFVEDNNRPPKGWITDSDIWKLMQYVSSRDEAAPVSLKSSSFLPQASSTVGNEAMYLIEGFKRGAYPPTACSVYDFAGVPSEYKKWWDAWTSRSGTKTRIGANTVRSNLPAREDVLKDTKTRALSIADQLIFSSESFFMGSGRVRVLVARLTGSVEYVWGPAYGYYIKPKFIMPNVQKMYDKFKR